MHQLILVVPMPYGPTPWHWHFVKKKLQISDGGDKWGWGFRDEGCCSQLLLRGNCKQANVNIIQANWRAL